MTITVTLNEVIAVACFKENSTLKIIESTTNARLLFHNTSSQRNYIFALNTFETHTLLTPSNQSKSVQIHSTTNNYPSKSSANSYIDGAKKVNPL